MATVDGLRFVPKSVLKTSECAVGKDVIVKYTCCSIHNPVINWTESVNSGFKVLPPDVHVNVRRTTLLDGKKIQRTVTAYFVDTNEETNKSAVFAASATSSVDYYSTELTTKLINGLVRRFKDPSLRYDDNTCDALDGIMVGVDSNFSTDDYMKDSFDITNVNISIEPKKVSVDDLRATALSRLMNSKTCAVAPVDYLAVMKKSVACADTEILKRKNDGWVIDDDLRKAVVSSFFCNKMSKIAEQAVVSFNSDKKKKNVTSNGSGSSSRDIDGDISSLFRILGLLAAGAGAVGVKEGVSSDSDSDSSETQETQEEPQEIPKISEKPTSDDDNTFIDDVIKILDDVNAKVKESKEKEKEKEKKNKDASFLDLLSQFIGPRPARADRADRADPADRADSDDDSSEY